MKHTALGVLAGLLVSAGGCQVGPRVEFVRGDKRIDVMIEGKHFTSYRYEETLTKPVLYPVKTPSGVVVNRSFPLVRVEGESEDHPHHVGVFFTYDRVNDDGFWNNATSPPQVEHVEVTTMRSGVGKGKLSTVMHWVGKSGTTLLQEKREMTFAAGKNEYVIDFEINLTAQDEEVVFADTKEGMFAIRVADWLREEGGSGTYLSSNGDETEENVWGKRARWVSLQGAKEDKTVGIAILNHPRSLNYPTYWHARRYGLFSANPLGQGDFETRRGLENPQWLNLTLEPGETAKFAFRMVVYEGARSEDELEEHFRGYTE
jgi:hypothetical protein